MVENGATARVDQDEVTMNCNRLICGDAIDELSKMPGACVDLVIADPPYNLGKDYGNNRDMKAWYDYEAFTRQWLAQAIRLLKPTGSLYVFMGVRFIAKLFVMLEAEFQLQFNLGSKWRWPRADQLVGSHGGCLGFCVNGISFKPVTSALQTGC